MTLLIIKRLLVKLRGSRVAPVACPILSRNVISVWHHVTACPILSCNVISVWHHVTACPILSRNVISVCHVMSYQCEQCNVYCASWADVRPGLTDSTFSWTAILHVHIAWRSASQTWYVCVIRGRVAVAVVCVLMCNVMLVACCVCCTSANVEELTSDTGCLKKRWLDTVHSSCEACLNQTDRQAWGLMRLSRHVDAV